MPALETILQRPAQEDLTLRPIADAADVQAVQRAARQQGHQVIAPTHVFTRHGQICGYASIAAVPVLTGWLHDDKVSQDEARAAIADLENLAREQGCQFLMMPVTDDCRFRNDMENMGWRGSLKRVRLWWKKLTI